MLFSKFVVVQSRGRFANQVIQAMAAQQIMEDLKLNRIYLPGIPSWGIAKSPNYDFREYQLRVEIKAKIPKTIRVGGAGSEWKLSLKRAEYRRVHLVGSGQHFQNFNRQKSFAQNLLRTDVHDSCCVRYIELESKLRDFHLVHIRQGDIFKDAILSRPDYYPLPVSFYESLASTSPKPLAFVGEVDANRDYLSMLRKRCKASIIVPSGCLHRDFNLLRNSEMLTIAISTFSWLAGWISEKAFEVNIPIAGFLNPKIRPDIDLTSGLPPQFIEHPVELPNTSNLEEFRKWLVQ
jgi:hypothetical protein